MERDRVRYRWPNGARCAVVFSVDPDAESGIVFGKPHEAATRLDEMIGGGLITLERARVIMYRPDLPPEERTESWPIDPTGRRPADPPSGT